MDERTSPAARIAKIGREPLETVSIPEEAWPYAKLAIDGAPVGEIKSVEVKPGPAAKRYLSKAFAYPLGKKPIEGEVHYDVPASPREEPTAPPPNRHQRRARSAVLRRMARALKIRSV